jgi:hypothetical protein
VVFHSKVIRPAHGILVLALLLAACAGAGQDSAQDRGEGQGRSLMAGGAIVPTPAYTFHELRLSDDAAAASGIDLNSGQQSPRILWEVNGTKVHTGPSLEPAYTHAGEKVTAIVQAEDGSGGWAELARYSCKIENSPPRVEDVQLERDSGNPYHFQAFVHASDSDEQAVVLHYHWFLDGKPLSDETKDSVLLSDQATGSQVQVEVVASDGEDSSIPARSPQLTVEAATVFLKVGEKAELQKEKDGGRRVILPLQYTDGARVQLLNAPSNVHFEPGRLVWVPGKDEKKLNLSVRVSTKDGSSVEREISLSI